MKLIQSLSAVIFTLLLITSCDKKEDPTEQTKTPSSAMVTVKFANEVDGQALEMGVMKYTNATGNMYEVDLLKYYVSKAVLVKSDNTEVAFNNFDLINAAEPGTCMINPIDVPNGTYTKIRFNIGIPSDRNHTGAQDGDLDPLMGMIWDWNTGYVFMKHEGKYQNSSAQTKGLVLHLATDNALTTVEVPFTTPLLIEGKAKTVFMKFNLNSVYSSPNNIDFNVDNNRQSSSSADATWMANTKANLADAFIFDKAE